MNEEKKNELLERNNAIIDAVKRKAEKVCPGSVALIAVTGSFCSGDFHEKSDLDLLIIINDDDGWRVSKTFILGDVAHDIYCSKWDQLEEMAECGNPHIIKLMNVDTVYVSDEKAQERYAALKEKAAAI